MNGLRYLRSSALKSVRYVCFRFGKLERNEIKESHDRNWVNPYQAFALFLYTMKTENLSFSDVSSLAWNELILSETYILFYKQKIWIVLSLHSMFFCYRKNFKNFFQTI